MGIAGILFGRGVIASAEASRRLPKVTHREREILRLLADGMTNEEIGREL